MDRLGKLAPEIGFTMGMVATTALFSVSLGLPISLPSGERAAFVGVHYLYPLLGLCLWGAIAAVGQRRHLVSTFVVALPCYAAVLLAHFNIKLWAPHINSVTWDDLYWRSDQVLRPLVDLCFAIRRLISPIVPFDSNLYMLAFIAMFYISFCFHAIKTPERFRSLFLAALYFQGLGAIAYLVMPALGPFLFEPGLDTNASSAQASMLATYRANAAGGATWLAANGGTHITAGLAAMPSLHAGGSFLFLIYAWRYAKSLVPTYLLLFTYLAISAVATRWHYFIDLPVGMALAWGCAWIAERITSPRNTETSIDTQGIAPSAQGVTLAAAPAALAE